MLLRLMRLLRLRLLWLILLLVGTVAFSACMLLRSLLLIVLLVDHLRRLVLLVRMLLWCGRLARVFLILRCLLVRIRI